MRHVHPSHSDLHVHRLVFLFKVNVVCNESFSSLELAAGILDAVTINKISDDFENKLNNTNV